MEGGDKLALKGDYKFWLWYNEWLRHKHNIEMELFSCQWEKQHALDIELKIEVEDWVPAKYMVHYII